MLRSATLASLLAAVVACSAVACSVGTDLDALRADASAPTDGAAGLDAATDVFVVDAGADVTIDAGPPFGCESLAAVTAPATRSNIDCPVSLPVVAGGQIADGEYILTKTDRFVSPDAGPAAISSLCASMMYSNDAARFVIQGKKLYVAALGNCPCSTPAKYRLIGDIQVAGNSFAIKTAPCDDGGAAHVVWGNVQGKYGIVGNSLLLAPEDAGGVHYELARQ